jgi:septal ring factor EnvC (AmiA/AmiB activator)
MERSTSVSTGMGEQSLTPGEQRILALMEAGQQRLEQRLDRVDQRLDRMDQRLDGMDRRLDRMDQQLQDLALKVDKEAAASRMRDRQLSTELQQLQQQGQDQKVWFRGEIERAQQVTLTSVFQELNALRTTLTERLDQHNLRLEVIEETLEKHGEHIRRNSEAIEGLQREMRKLTEVVDGLVQAQPPRIAPAP